MASNYHIELNPSDVGLYDYVVVQEIIKEIAQNKQLDVSAKHPFKGWSARSSSAVVVLLSEADSLARNAQAGLRRTMEKYSSNCRLVLCCENVSRIIAPIRSRCLCVRVSAPTPLEVITGNSCYVGDEHIETELPEGGSVLSSAAAAADRSGSRCVRVRTRLPIATFDERCSCWNRAQRTVRKRSRTSS